MPRCTCKPADMWRVGFVNPCFVGIPRPLSLEERIDWAETRLDVRVRLNQFLAQTGRAEYASKRHEGMWEKHLLNLYNEQEQVNAN